MRLLLIAFFSMIIFMQGEARADCANPHASVGTIIFNGTHNAFQGCTRAGVWVAFHAKPSDPCLAGDLGTACADGAFYIGSLPGGPRIYAAPADESGAPRWSGDSGGVPGTQSTTDGFANSYPAMVGDSHLFPAGYACTSKAPAGTWYLPAKDELNLLWENRAQLNLAGKGFTIGDGYDYSYYWSSSEHEHNFAWAQRFSTGSQADMAKYETFRVRCVRR